MVDLDKIRKRWGDAKKGSQYYADIHALMDEVEVLGDRNEYLSEENKAFEETIDGWQEHSDSIKLENRRLRKALQSIARRPTLPEQMTGMAVGMRETAKRALEEK